MRKIITLSLSAAATLAVGGVAYAQAAPNVARPGLTRAAVQERATKAFGRIDANDDGVLNQADREARQKAVFDRVDADHNGAISLAEFSAVREERREARAESGGPDGPRFARRALGGPGGPGMARMADTDRDGTVTQAEFTQAALTRFDRADADKDGTISRDERRGMRGFGRGLRRGPGGGPRPAPEAG
jgi:Ca2+-binding EF-hand superfamily protein